MALAYAWMPWKSAWAICWRYVPLRSISASQWLKNPELEVVQTKNDVAGSSFVLDAQQVSLTDTDEAEGAKRPVRAVAGSAK